jgi:hypothetical protein
MVVLVGWYTETEWSKVKACATDKERFEDSFVQWEQMASEALNDLCANGVNAEKALVECDSLLAWCIAHNRKNDAEARAQYVSELCVRRNTGGA